MSPERLVQPPEPRPGARGLVLDITRTVARARHETLSGIDRVERAYLDWTLRPSADLRLYLCRLGDGWRLLDRAGALSVSGFLDGGHEPPALDMRGRMRPAKPLRLRQAETLVRRHGKRIVQPGHLGTLLAALLPEGGVYLNVGHDDLVPPLIDTVRAAGLMAVVMMHDAIPLDFPEFARDDGPERFRTKLAAATRADLIIANSDHTGERVAHWLAQEGHSAPPMVTLPLGIGEPPSLSAFDRSKAPERPDFLQLGTIEPRKNHLLILGIWRRFWERLGPERSPRLAIVGRRGWENEQVLDLLDRSPMMGVTVREIPDLDDARLMRLMSEATSLLMPSFAEGFGLPLGEALSVGLPVIASDLPAHRALGGDVPDWLDPLDGLGWMTLIEDHARPKSPARTGQLARLRAWTPPSWADHFAGLAAHLPKGLAPIPAAP